MEYAEKYALPVAGELGATFPRRNDLNELFYIRWGRIRFEVFWGVEVNIKVILKVHRYDSPSELFFVDTEPYDVQWNKHKRMTRDFYLHPHPKKLGRIRSVSLSYIVHHRWRSIPSRYDYVFMEEPDFQADRPSGRRIPGHANVLNSYHAYELDASLLQRDVDWCNHHFESLRLTPKLTKGLPYHPYHPKRYIHDHIDLIIQRKRANPERAQTIKVCVDCIDDADFINHLIHAHNNGVTVQCIVDWRKMTLTNSDNYVRLKWSGIELLGVFCTIREPSMEVEADMHNKFIIFGEQDCILGSFNITFDRWGANWESGMTFHSQAVCRLLDNIFQSVRGGVIQRYGIDPLSHFNILYTFGRHATMEGKFYRPHHAILAEIQRAKRSIKLCLFLIGNLYGEHRDSAIDALIAAYRRGVDVRIILNGHLARDGDPGKEYTMPEELNRPLLPAVEHLKRAGIPVALAYGLEDRRVPYSPLHCKYGVFDDTVVLDGSFNWYNTSTFSHDHVIIAANKDVAGPYLHEFQQILNCFRIFW